MSDTNRPDPFDPYCKRAVSDIGEYVDGARFEGITAGEIAREDGTYNPETNEVCCTECYIRLGQPSGPRGWKAGWPMPGGS